MNIDLCKNTCFADFMAFLLRSLQEKEGSTIASLRPPTRNFFSCPESCKRKLAANTASPRVLASANSLRDFESRFEGGRDLGQLFGRYVFVKSKGPRIAPLEVERDWMLSSKRAPRQFRLIGHEGPGFGIISGVDEGR